MVEAEMQSQTMTVLEKPALEKRRRSAARKKLQTMKRGRRSFDILRNDLRAYCNPEVSFDVRYVSALCLYRCKQSPSRLFFFRVRSLTSRLFFLRVRSLTSHLRSIRRLHHGAASRQGGQGERSNRRASAYRSQKCNDLVNHSFFFASKLLNGLFVRFSHHMHRMATRRLAGRAMAARGRRSSGGASCDSYASMEKVWVVS